MEVFVARQPIFTPARELYAYELLFRADDLHNHCGAAEESSATTQVIANSLLSIGLENIVGDKRAFINFNRTLLAAGLHEILPPERIVLEILESVDPSEDLVALCRALQGQGYTLALDDYTGDPRFEPLIGIVRMIKVDIQETSLAEQERILRSYQPRGIAVIAEKVETSEEFERTRRAGFNYFQGYFFARPSLVRGHQIPAAKFNCIRLMREVQKSDLDFTHLASLILEDLSFSYKLLRYVNSALYFHRTEIASIQQALMMLGETGVRHWVVLAALPELAKDKPGELVTHSLVRASFCDRLVQLTGVGDHSQGFLAGLFSLLDALIDVPLEEALRQVGVGPPIAGALLGTAGEQDTLGNVYRLACCYEKCDWTMVSALASRLRIDASDLGQAYSDATLWAQHALHATVRTGNSRREARHKVEGSLRVLWEDAQRRERISIAQVRNVSRSGLNLLVDDKIPVHTLISCNAPEIGVSGTGSVRYCNPFKGRYLIGVEFSNGTGWSELPASKPNRRN